MRLLVVEDDGILREEIRRRAVQAGFVVDAVDNGVDGEHLGDEIEYDAVILDLGLPLRDGLAVLQHWRSAGRILPVLVLTARDAWFEKVAGFQAGADDYLGKPFHMEELMARIGALIRRGGGQSGGILSRGDLQLDEDRRTVQVGSMPPQVLSRIEYRLLHLFLTHPDRVWSKARIEEHLYDEATEHDSNVIEVHVRRLRRKIGSARIETVRGIGYRLAPSTPSADAACTPPESG